MEASLCYVVKLYPKTNKQNHKTNNAIGGECYDGAIGGECYDGDCGLWVFRGSINHTELGEIDSGGLLQRGRTG